MSPNPQLPQNLFATPGDEKRRLACARLLLYLHGLNIASEPSLEIVMESLRRAGPDAGTDAALLEMRGILREYGVTHTVVDAEGNGLRSAPPLNRRSMITDSVICLSLTDCVRRGISRLFRSADARKGK